MSIRHSLTSHTYFQTLSFYPTVSPRLDLFNYFTQLQSCLFAMLDSSSRFLGSSAHIQQSLLTLVLRHLLPRQREYNYLSQPSLLELYEQYHDIHILLACPCRHFVDLYRHSTPLLGQPGHLTQAHLTQPHLQGKTIQLPVHYSIHLIPQIFTIPLFNSLAKYQLDLRLLPLLHQLPLQRE